MPAYGYSNDDLRLMNETGVDPHDGTAVMNRWAWAPEMRPFWEEIAARYDKPVWAVAFWYDEYCRDCRLYDQSAVQSEFEQWYAGRLGAPKEAS
jgi:hypothetical protein